VVMVTAITIWGSRVIGVRTTVGHVTVTVVMVIVITTWVSRVTGVITIVDHVRGIAGTDCAITI